MPKTPIAERRASLQVLGAIAIAALLFFVWLTYAVFSKTFSDFVPVTITTSEAGLQLPDNADVKIRGMLVGEVRDVVLKGDGVELQLALNPEHIDLIPAGVTARLVPKTVFGQKFVNLIPPENPGGATLEAGDNIDEAVVPIEVADLFNNLYPLLEAVQPAELSYTLSAVAEALSGRGEAVGDTLVTLNKYLIEVNPDVPALVDDLVKLGNVAEGYADVMPELGRLLNNLVVTGDTIVAKRSQLSAFFKEGIALSNTTTNFVAANDENLITLAKEGQPLLQIVADHSGTVPCLLGGINNLIPKLNDAFRDSTLHINLELLPLADQPTGYRPTENPVIPSRSAIVSTEKELGLPSCFTLPTPPYNQENPGPIPPYSIYKLVGIECDHNKFNIDGSGDTECAPAAGALPRTAVGDQALIDLVQPSLSQTDQDAERKYINALVGASLGVTAAQMPDVASVLFEPVMDGVGVRVSETR